jgi:hypothetical protein
MLYSNTLFTKHPPMDSATNTEGKEINRYIKVNENHVINEKYIKWLKKYDECVMVCNKPEGCYEPQTYTVCKNNNPTSYERLNRHFL